MAGINLRGAQIGEFSIARGELRVDVETFLQLEQADDKLRLVGEHLHDIEDVESGRLIFVINRADFGRSFMRFNSWNP